MTNYVRDTSPTTYQPPPVDRTDAPTPSYDGLSPEMMLAFLRGNLEELDEAINAELQALDNRRGEMQQLGNGIQQIRDMENLARDNHADVLATDVLDGKSVEETIRDLGFSGEEIDRLKGDGENFTAADLVSMRENLQSQLDELNNSTEYDVMKVQTMMQSRSQLVQLTSNILRDLNEAAMAAIKNI